jgi:integrase
MAKSSKGTRRRSAGEGSVYQAAGGRWRGAIAWTNADGTRRRRFVSGATGAECRDKLDQLRRNLRLGAPGTSELRQTVGTYLEAWIERDHGRVRPSTWRVRDGHVRVHLIPALGPIPLVALAPVDVERAIASAIANGAATPSPGKARRGVSPMTARHIRATLRRALADAVRDGLVLRNAAADARPMRVPHRPVVYLASPDLRRLLDATAQDQHGPLYALAATTGLRLGELLGLAWRDINVSAGTLTVRQSLALDAAGGWELAEPKSARSRRTIPLPAIAREALEQRRAAQERHRAASGSAWQDRAGLVFTDAVGRSLRPGAVSHAFRRAVDAAGIPPVRFHDLRHSAATLMLTHGVPLAVISDWLGHAGIAITAAHYAAIVPQLHRDAAAAVDRALSADTSLPSSRSARQYGRGESPS